MKREKIKYALVSILMAGCCLGSLHVSAYTADDIAAKARENSWPENVVQQCYNQWTSGKYTQEELDQIYERISEWSKELDDFFKNYFQLPDEPSETEPADTKAKEDDTSGGRISQEEFINMTFEEKRAYIYSLDEAARQAFLSSLSPEERNSLLKQLPAEDKAALMQTYIDVAEEMGINVTVDSLTNNDISLTVRDEEGTIIDKTALGVVIDETGLPHTKPLLVSVGGTLLAVLGFGGLYAYIRKTEE